MPRWESNALMKELADAAATATAPVRPTGGPGLLGISWALVKEAFKPAAPDVEEGSATKSAPLKFR